MRRARLFVAALLAVLCFVPDGVVSDALAARHAAKGAHRNAHAVKSKSKWKSNAKSKKKKKRRRRRPVGPRLYSGVPLKILSSRTVQLDSGVTYTEKIISRNKWRVGVVHAALDHGWRVALVKAKERAVGFERVESLVHRLDSAQGLECVAGVNAAYWRAGVGTVIGPSVCDGEVVGFDNIKPWARLMITRGGEFHIAADSLAGWMYPVRGNPLRIAGVNARMADTGVVLYNHYFGATLPPVDTTVRGDSLTPRRGVDSALARFLQDTTELFYETDEDVVLTDTTAPKPRSEEATLKCMAVWVDSPRVNIPWRCRVTAMTSRLVPILRNGIALSFPRADSATFRTIHTGDTLTLQFQAGDGSAGDVTQMLMAGPRLVRRGRVSLETAQENFHRGSFINGGHARTAIGVNVKQDEVILVTIDRPMGTRKAGRPGIGLNDLARIMVMEGSYDAMNFDGGSSTTLVVNGRTVLPDTGVEFSRHVASALVIMRRKGKGSGGRD